MPNKERIEERQRKIRQVERQQQMRTYAIVGGIAAAVLLLLAGWILVPSLTRPTASTGSGICKDVQELTDEGRGHLTSPLQTPVYNQEPPTSGTHNPEWMPAGVYATTQDSTKLVHSLEHGYIVIYHRDLKQDELLTLANFARSEAYKIIVNPYAKAPARVTLTAWDHMQQCDGVDVPAIRAFVGAYRDQGPEQGAP